MRQLRLDQSPLIGMIHLPALPGAPRYGGTMAPVVDRALRDAETLAAGGVDAVLVENFGDVPFFAGSAPRETVAAMAAVVERVTGAVDLPVGVNVLRNDGASALAVAAATGGSFIRVNVLSWARLTDQGVVEGRAAELMRRRSALGAEEVLVLADVAVKHSAPLAEVSAAREAKDVAERGLADAVVVTGEATGWAADLRMLEQIASEVLVPVVAGSGVTPNNAPAVRAAASGAIVGSSMMEGGRAGGPVTLQRATRLAAAWRGEGG